MENIQNNELLTPSEFAEFMFKQIVPLSDIKDYEENPIHKIIPFWRRHNLVPFMPLGKHTFAEISLVQLIWIRILDSLRELSYPLDNMKKICEYFFKDAYENDLPRQNIEYNKKLLEAKKSKNIITYEESILLTQLNDFLEDKHLMQFLKFDINYLSNLIKHCLTSTLEAGMLIYPTGRVIEHLGNDTFSHQKIDFDTNSPHIYLSIKYFLKEFIEHQELEKLIMPQILSSDEKNVLEELRNENIQELIIKKNGNEIIRIDKSHNSIIIGEKAKQIKQILGLKNYEEVEISTRDEKTLSFKKRTKDIKTKK